MSEWKEYKLIDLASNEKNSFIDGDWIESPHIKDTGIRLIQTGNIGKGFFRDSNKKYISEESFQRLNCKEVKPGDVLICRLADPIGRSCKVPDLKTKNITSVDVTIFKIDQYRFDENFVLQLINTDEFLSKATEVAGGSTRQRISRSNLANLRVRIPELLAEQQKIASIFMACDAVIEKTQAAIEKYKAIKQGMLHDLFTRGIDVATGKLRPKYEHAPELYKESKLGWIPLEWDVKIFGEEIDLIHGHQFRNFDFTEFGIPVVKIGQVTPENIDLNGCSYVGYDRVEEFVNEIIRNGDVLMALTGATLGKACLVSGFNGIALQNYRVGRFEPLIKENNIDKIFLYYTMIEGELLIQIFNKVNSGAQGNIGKADFEKAFFKKPPYKEQNMISQRILSIDNKLKAEQTYLYKLQQIKAGLMNDLLSGKKRVKLMEEALAAAN